MDELTAKRDFEDLDDRPLPESDDTRAEQAPPAPLQPAETSAPVERIDPASEGDANNLDPPLMRRIIYLATARPGDTPPFARAQPNLDGKGLCYGIGRFSQASGALGALLAMMQAEDPDRFAEIFADISDDMLPDPDIEELLRVTQAPIPEGSTDRSARLRDVSGRPLWDPAWIRKFKAAAQVETFQAVQYRFTAEHALIPMLEFARDLGLDTERGLAMLSERAILLGITPAQEFIIDAAGPINTDALRSAALTHVAPDPGNATLAAFQEAKGVPERRGHFGPLSHAALVAALRQSGNPPMQLPLADLMLDQIVQAANRTGMPGLLPGIRSNPNLSDAPLSAADPEME